MLTKNQFLEINKIALLYFLKSFQSNHEAKEYVYSRISKEIADKFYIGYSPFNGLVNYAQTKKITIEELIKLNLISLNTENKTAIEFFRNRIMFPIFNINNVVGFSGRSCGNGKPKYLNSRNNELFHKSSLFYILDFAKKFIFEKKFAIIVEGQFDVLGLIDAGICNVIAPCGTALSNEHARILKRWTNTVYICYDGDLAGKNAAKKTKVVLSENKLDSYIINLPEGYDPDQFVKKYGPNNFLRLRG